LYAPDYVANAGGVLNGCRELFGWADEQALSKIDDIYDTILRIYESAHAQGITTNKAADRLAEDRLRRAGQ
jgi:leucine dehydrogenase